MKKFFMLIASLLLACNMFANDFVKVSFAGVYNMEYHDHETFESWYDVDKKNPLVVIWDLTNVEAIDSEAYSNRVDIFVTCGNSATKQDFVKQTYINAKGKKSTYQKGHMCPSDDREWSKEASGNVSRMCNMSPQTTLNQGKWKTYEKHGHELAKKYGLVTIVAGPIFDNCDTVIGNKNKIVVPTRFYKLFVIDGEVLESYIFSQDNTFRKANLEEIEELTNIQFVLITKN